MSRALATVALLALAALAGVLAVRAQPVAGSPPISPAERAAGPRFAAELSAADREWILAAIAAARPEAQALIAEIDGTVVFATTPGPMMGVARLRQHGARVELNVGQLNGRRVADRSSTVLHELGHVIDFALVDQGLDDRLDAAIPRTGTCVQDATVAMGACTEPEERFADTFAKWALRGGVSGVGAGYGVATPASLEDWGAPLATLAAGLGAPQ